MLKHILIYIQYKQKQGTKYKKYFQINACNRSFTVIFISSEVTIFF